MLVAFKILSSYYPVLYSQRALVHLGAVEGLVPASVGIASEVVLSFVMVALGRVEIVFNINKL